MSGDDLATAGVEDVRMDDATRRAALRETASIVEQVARDDEARKIEAYFRRCADAARRSPTATRMEVVANRAVIANFISAANAVASRAYRRKSP